MGAGLATFDESWHRVAERFIRLRPGVKIVAQRFRGQRWYVVCDALGNRFFRIRPPAYRFICELEKSDTVNAAWQKILGLTPEDAPGQSEVVQLLSQLHQLGLLRSDLEGDVVALFKAAQKKRNQEVKQQWASLFFIRIPIFNPDAFLKATLHVVAPFISRWAFVIWAVILGLGIKAVAENWQLFTAESSALLGIANLPWLYLTMAVLKGLHEFGHGYFCRKYGGEVPVMGIMLLLFNPLPYMDASSSWAFREKHRRMLVGAAGILVELLLAAIAAMIWANTGAGTLHRVAYNAVVIASVGTILFNLNPLLRYDGYHILTDWVEIPNLHSRASRTVVYLMERYLFGVETAQNPSENKRQTWFLVAYYFAALLYRTLLLIGILFFVSKQFLMLGIILALIFAVLWLVVPIIKAVKYLLFEPRLEMQRSRVLGITSGLAAIIFVILAFVPVPSHFRANGVVRSEVYARIYTGTSGELVEVVAPSGDMVVAGTPLLRLQSFELEQEIRLAQMDLKVAEADNRAALEADPVRFMTMASYLEALQSRLARLEADRMELLVRAPCDGRWLAPGLGASIGSVMRKGQELGTVQGEDSHYFSAVVRQRDVGRLFSGNIEATEVKVMGQEQRTLTVSDIQAIPAEQGVLPSAALGVRSGGTTGVQATEDNISRRSSTGLGLADSARGTQTMEPFFEVRAILQPSSGDILLHGQGGVARLELPWEPLLAQWSRSIRQLFQRNYRL